MRYILPSGIHRSCGFPRKFPKIIITTTTTMPPKRKATTSKAVADDQPSSAKKTKSGSKLSIGDNVSSVLVKLITEDEREVTLSELTEEKGAVIFMYPRANTPGCTKQACGFKDNYNDITDNGFDVYGLSFDKPKSQSNWKNKYSLPYHLLTDDGTALKAFGAFKQPKNILRSHVVIKKGGELIDIQNGISPGDSFTEAVKTVKSLK